jgi:hypothetical protein
MKQRVFSILSLMLLAIKLLAEGTETTISVTFADFPKGASEAINERHDLGGGLVIYTTKCHFTSELRIYSSASNNGYVVSDPLPGYITSMSFNMGYNTDVLNVYGGTDKTDWILIKEINVNQGKDKYGNYTLSFPANTNYTCFKLDVKGENQIRIKSMSVTYISADDNEGGEDNGGNTGGGNEDEGGADEELKIVSAPVFNPVSTSFSTDYLDVTIEAADGCEIYYTKDGSTPSYTTAENYGGTKGNIVTIYAADSKVTLQAIAVDPTTGQCSGVSSAIYTYVPISANDGSKTKPYTVEEVAVMRDKKTGKWVRGTIYGTMIAENPKDIATFNFSVESNLVIGDAEINIPVQLPTGDVRMGINLKGHPYLKCKEILIKGDLEEYCGVRGIKNPTEYQITYDIPINSYGYATLYLDMSVSVPDDCSAYYCSTEGSYVNLLPVGEVIPGNVGVVINAEPNKTYSFTYTTESNGDEEAILSTNQLVGFMQDMVVADEMNVYYALNVKNNKLGFYLPQTSTDEGFTAKAYKAYLKIPVEHKVSVFFIHRGDDETSIVPIADISEDVVYDLHGRIVSSPVPGIYIRGGKKIVIR